MLPVFGSFGGNQVVKWIFYKTENCELYPLQVMVDLQNLPKARKS